VTRYSLAFTGVSEEFSAGSLEMSVSIQKDTWCNDPESHKMIKYMCFIWKIFGFIGKIPTVCWAKIRSSL
jgi:hypothetical protein